MLSQLKRLGIQWDKHFTPMKQVKGFIGPRQQDLRFATTGRVSVKIAGKGSFLMATHRENRKQKGISEYE